MHATDEVYTVSRIATTGAAAVLNRLVGTDLVERGSVVVLSVEAIRERAGERWPRKRDDVWAYVERKLDEHLSYHDLRQRVAETDFLVAMTSEDGAAAQAICMKILEEVLTHFVGSAEKIDVKIRAVRSVQDGELSCMDLDPHRIEAASREAPTAYQRQADPEAVGRRTPISFVIASGEEMRIDYVLEPVISLRHQVTAAMRVRPIVSYARGGVVVPSRAFAKLADEDVAFIDRATVAFGALFLTQASTSRPALIMPASFRTMAGRRGRAALATTEGISPEQMKRGAIIELIEVDRGTPQGRLGEVVGLVGQLARGVMVRLQPTRDALARVRGVRLQGLTLDLTDMPIEGEKLAALLRAMALQMRGACPTLMVQGLPDIRDRTLAWEAGFTHAGARTPAPTLTAASDRSAA